jgi:predicted transcriptional regulator YheO
MSRLDQAWFLDVLERLAEGIVAVVGPHCEVVVHDFRDPEHSIIYMAGNVTGRRVGAPVPDLSFISGELDRDTPDQLNYRTGMGSHHLQSSTIWIPGEDGTPIGSICVNVDYQDLNHARQLLDKLATSTQHVSDFTVTDTFAKDVDDLIGLSISEFLRQEGAQSVGALGAREKLRLIQTLEERGLFQIRGAVNRVAGLLDVSRATIYNYRANLKNEVASASVLEDDAIEE